jgi:hypothetical protein
MLKSLLKAAVAPAVLMLGIAPAHAAETQATPASGGYVATKDDAAIFEMFAKLFDTGDKTPIDPAQLALGQKTAAALLPEGSYGKLMDQVLGKFLEPILEMAPGLSASMIATQTGMDYVAAEKLTEEQLKAIQAIIDPQRKEREGGMLALMRPMMVEVGKLVEPPLREGIGRAYARNYSAAQLNEINAFFATPTGKAYANGSFAVQFDPEVLSATMQAMPMMMTKIMGGFGDLDGQMKALPQERKLTELSAAELDSLSKLVGRTPAELTAHAKDMAEMEAAAKAAADAAGAEATADAAVSSDTGDEPWFDRSNCWKHSRARCLKSKCRPKKPPLPAPRHGWRRRSDRFADQ